MTPDDNVTVDQHVQSEAPVHRAVVPVCSTWLPRREADGERKCASCSREEATRRRRWIDDKGRGMVEVRVGVLSARTGGLHGRRRATLVGAAGLVSTSILLINTSNACASLPSTVSPATSATLSPVPPPARLLSSTRRRGAMLRRLRRERGSAFVSAVEGTRYRASCSHGNTSLYNNPNLSDWDMRRSRAGVRSGSSGGEDSRQCRSGLAQDAKSSRSLFGRMMIAAGSTGDALLPSSDDHWSLRSKRPTVRKPSSSGHVKPTAKRRVGRPSKRDAAAAAAAAAAAVDSTPGSTSANGDHGRSGSGARTMSSTAAAVERKPVQRVDNLSGAENESDVGSPAGSAWTPKQQGEGSWNKWEAKAKELEPPEWEMNLPRGVSVADVTLSKVSDPRSVRC